MRAILGAMRRCIADYEMIEDGDKIAVGVSGGKDSMLLLEGLYRLRKFLDMDFELTAITIDPCFGNKNGDFSLVEDFCAQRDIPYIIRRTQLSEIIFDVRKEKNPCSLCSKMRRGIIHGITKDIGYNKLALGHHMDDVAETFMMNLFSGGKLACFQPVTYLSRKDLTMIRPLLYIREKHVTRAVNKLQIPVIKSGCPVDGVTYREKTKNWIRETERGVAPNLTEKIFGAVASSNLQGWNALEHDREKTNLDILTELN